MRLFLLKLGMQVNVIWSALVIFCWLVTMTIGGFVLVYERSDSAADFIEGAIWLLGFSAVAFVLWLAGDLAALAWCRLLGDR